jgi:thiosulfate/3-mercaptopyruvate sulfurtransferase
MGFGDHSIIVAYDDRGGAVASRLWWMLRSIGHDAVAVLDGGLPAWRSTGGPLSTAPTSRSPARLTVRRQPRTIDATSLQANLGSVTLIDARDGDRYRGEREPVDPVAGHIPTAINLPMTGNLAENDRFLAPGTLRARFETEVDPHRDTVVYCGSGVTACHDILAMEIAGLPAAMLYPGSWSDWCAIERPIATGEDPGTR